MAATPAPASSEAPRSPPESGSAASNAVAAGLREVASQALAEAAHPGRPAGRPHQLPAAATDGPEDFGDPAAPAAATAAGITEPASAETASPAARAGTHTNPPSALPAASGATPADRPAEPTIAREAGPAEAAKPAAPIELAPAAVAAHPGPPLAGAAEPATSALPNHHPIVANVPLAAVPVEIAMKSLSGVSRFEIRLDPEDLGRIDVRLDIDDAGLVTARLVVERVETLALLQRDARTLERAFEQAGLKSSEGGIDLTLRDPSGDARGQQRDGRAHQGADPPRPSTQPDADETAPARVLRTLWAPTGRLDLHI